MAPLKLFCFPYAGGSSWIYRQLGCHLAGRIEVLPIDLPGRGRRRAEPCIDNWAAVTGALASELEPHLDERHAFFGYSLGALVALEIMHELAARCRRRATHTRPLALVACASRGPRTIRHEQLLHRMDDRPMFEALRDLGGIPDQLLESPELIALSAPSMRADLKLFETYSQAGHTLHGVPIHAYHGNADANVGEDFLAWRHETDASFHSRAFDGGHMFLHNDASALADALAADLDSYGRQVKTA